MSKVPVLTLAESGDTLDLTGRYEELAALIEQHGDLVWDREGVRRRVPRALVRDAARILRDRLNAPVRTVATLPPVTVAWSAVSPGSAEPGSSDRLLAFLLRRLTDPSSPTPSD